MALAWQGITNLGKKVMMNDTDIDPAWTTPSGIIYCDGFSCRRTYNDEEKNVKYEIINNINKSTLGKPLFESIITSSSDIKSRFISSNPSTVYRKVVEKLNIALKGKLVGNRFFGMLSKDFKVAMESYDDSNQRRLNENVSTVDIVTDPIYVRQCSFKCVVSYGVPVNNPCYIKVIGKTNCRLQPGYEIIRIIKLPDNSTVELHLKIEQSDTGPTFKAFTLSVPVIEYTSNKVCDVVKSSLNSLNIVTKKKWSGSEFFGLTRSDVLNVITKPIFEIGITPDHDNIETIY